MALGTLAITSPGSVTAPTSLAVSVSSALTAALRDFAHSDVVQIPSIKAVMLCDGVNFQYHYIDSLQHLNGPLAPGAAAAASSTATRATETLAFSALPTDGDQIRIGKPGTNGNGLLTFKTTLDATLNVDQVAMGANVDALLANIQKFINGTGTQGTDFFSARMANFQDPTPGWDTENDIEVSAIDTSADTVTFRARTYGVAGNGYLAVIVTNAGGTMSGISGYMGGGAAGTGTTPGQGTYVHAYAFVRDEDGAQTAISPTSTTQNGGNCNMTVASFATPPTRDGIDFKRVFRSTVGGGSVLYKAEDTAGSSFTDDVTDATLTGDFALLYDERLFRPYVAGYPPRFQSGCYFQGSVFGTGAVLDAVRSSGTVSVTQGSKTATFSAVARYKTNIIGRTLKVGSDALGYIICDFVESTRVATLNRAYEGTGGSTESYVLTDTRDPYEVFWTPPQLVNNWPVTNSVKGITSPDGLGNMAIRALDNIYVWTRVGLWSLVGGPETGFRISPQGEGCGAWCNRAVVNAEGVFYWVGPDGLFGWAGGSTPPGSLSNPPVTQVGTSRGIADTVNQINPDAAGGIVSVYNSTENLIRWFVPLDSSPWNDHVIVLDLQTGAFSLDTCPPVTAAATVVGPDGQYQTVIGTAHGDLFQLGLSTSDGAYGFDPQATVSSYTASTKTIATGSSVFPTTGDGIKGLPVVHVTTTGTVQIGYVASNTSGNLVLVSPLTTAPASGDTVIVGGIYFRVQSGKCDFGAPEIDKNLSSIILTFTPSAAAVQLWAAGSVDNSDPTVLTLRSSSAADVVSLASTGGTKKFYLRKGPGVRTQFEIVAFSPGGDVSLAGWKVEIPVLDEAAA